MEVRDLFDALSRIDAASLAASGTVLLGNLAIILICGWALYLTGERAFAWLLLAAAGGNVMIIADFLLAPQVTTWAPASAQGWKMFRFVVYAVLAGLRAWGVWLLARRFLQFVQERRAAGKADE
ncbi:MAG: hypothetical protein JSR82_03895 [Verrucomicrobia bacterium]|nr:hypothetical protein [Verrucomicrobiota bacterium]